MNDQPWQGSPKQIAWAKSIRAAWLRKQPEVRAALEAVVASTAVAAQRWRSSASSANHAADAHLMAQATLRALDWVPSITIALFWIETRDSSPAGVVDRARIARERGLL